MNNNRYNRQFILRVLGGICMVLLGCVLVLADTALTMKRNGMEKTSAVEMNGPGFVFMSDSSELVLMLEHEKDAQETSESDINALPAEERVPLDLEDYENAPKDNGCPYYIKVNRTQNVVTIYSLDEEGLYTVPVRAMVCSVGRNNATPTGTFTTSDKHEWSALVGGVYGQYAYRIDGHIMFHSVPYFRRDKGRLETEEYNKLGSAASLGCVRLAVLDAKWIYDNCPSGTLVTIYDNEYPGPFGKPVAEYIDPEDERAGWDPTDPDTDNPWNDGDIRILGAGDREVERAYACNLLAGVMALDEKGNDLTEYLTIDGNVDLFSCGADTVNYVVTTPNGREVSKEGRIHVSDHLAPQILLRDGELHLNRIEMSKANMHTAITRQLQLLDAGEELSADHFRLKLDTIQYNETSADIEVYAIDDYGNRTEKYIYTVSLDDRTPVIGTPDVRTITISDEKEIKQKLLELIPVSDDGSGIAEVKVTWTKHISSNRYSVMVIAKDQYGNVSTCFFDDFQINYE